MVKGGYVVLISLQNIDRVYKNGVENLYALNDINLNITHNEFISIVGPSGCGKSTLLNVIGMIDSNYSGEYYFDGNLIKKQEHKKMGMIRNSFFGFIFQQYALIKNMTIYENVKLPLEYSEKENKNEKERVYEVLEKLNIFKKRNLYPNELSGGECQRVAIARALINDPKVILADEPTGALDRKNKEIIMSLLKEINKSGKIVVLVTHDLSLTKECSHIIEMKYGKIINNI